MPEELAALARQLEAVEARLSTRLARIETSLLGDQEMNVDGLAAQLRKLTINDERADTVHAEMEERRREGDAVLHKRFDRIEKLAYFALGVAAAAGGGTVFQWFL